jgi:competence protein ComEC
MRGQGQVQAFAPIQQAMLRQRGHLLGWVPVVFSIGIGAYFGLDFEPDLQIYLYVAAVGMMSVVLGRLAGPALSPVFFGLALAAAGAIVAGGRSHWVADPVLGFRYYGAVEGRIIGIDRSSKDAPRLTLDRVVLDDVAPDRTPARVRISLQPQSLGFEPEPGMVVILTANLSPPAGPVEPGDFDFRQMAWYDRLGAVGYTRAPVLLWRPAVEGQGGLSLFRLRLWLSAQVRARIGGEAGGFAAAVTTGDRSGISAATNQEMRDSNLYHLVSISGTHMGLLAAFVFGLIRYGLALVPPVALRINSKKVAAFVALMAAAFYFAVAGQDVPTERSFIMVAVMLVAVMLDRRALTLRSVALAGMVVLVLRPESLINPGFQMSFAATVALVAAFGGLAQMPEGRLTPPRWMRPALMLVLSSLVAGTATAPFAAAHFNRIADYGLIANLLAVPAMGLLVMPGAVILALTAPFGLDQPAVWMIEVGSEWILFVSHTVAGWDGAVSAVPSPPLQVLPVMALGGLFIVLWQGRARILGALPIALAFVIWSQSTRPALLVADSGALIGVLTEAGRSLSKPRGDSFAAESWLENDGSVMVQEAANGLPGLDVQGKAIRVTVAGTQVLVLTGEVAPREMPDCGGADILILSIVDQADRPCDVYDIARLRETGALAGRIEEGALVLQTSREVTGTRLWSPAPRPRYTALAGTP